MSDLNILITWVFDVFTTYFNFVTSTLLLTIPLVIVLIRKLLKFFNLL